MFKKVKKIRTSRTHMRVHRRLRSLNIVTTYSTRIAKVLIKVEDR